MTATNLVPLLSIAALLVSAGNFILLLATYRRASQWRDGEAAQDLIRRLGECETGLGAVSGQGSRVNDLAQRVASAEGAITGLLTRMENVATKADVSRLTAEVNGLEKHVDAGLKRVEGGVERIEHLLMRGPLA